MIRLNKKYILPLLSAFVFILWACKEHKAPIESSIKTYTVKVSSAQKTMHFTGTIQPLHKSALMTQMNAVVLSMPYHYGQVVKKGETIFTLNSEELQRDYNDTLTDYLKAKDSYHVMAAKFSGTEDLWKSGLISKNNYLSDMSSLNTTRVTLMQATRKLSELLEKMDPSQHEDLTALSFEEFDKVQMALTTKHNLLHITAPNTGVLLYPPKGQDDKLGSLGVGSQVKASQVLGLIGDLSGISIEIDVPEVDIIDLKVGMPARISGIAFGRETLEGHVVAINDEATMSGGSALPSFSAIVEVHDLTPMQQVFVRVGMSAQVELLLDKSKKLMIPIEALHQETTGAAVNVLGADGKSSLRKVVTGDVNGAEVVIESGLKEGEKVVYG